MSIGEIAGAAFELGAELLVGKLTGKGKDAHPDLEEMLKEAARNAVAAGEEKLEREVRAVIDILQLGFAIRDTVDLVAETPKAFDPPANPKSIPGLLEMTQVGPDEKLEETTVAPVDEKFDPEDK